MKQIFGVLLLLILMGIYIHQAAPSVTTGDSGEFMTAAATLSLVHAPSFPLTTLVGRVWLDLIPFGSIPLKMNYLSAFFSALSLYLVFYLLTDLKLSIFGSAGLSLLAGTTTSFWSNSLVTEAFALNSVFAVALLLCLKRADRGPGYEVLFSFLLGLGLGNHQILVVVGISVIWLWWLQKRWSECVARLPMLFLFFLAGISVYMVLPVRSMNNPPLNWGQPTTVNRFIRTVTRQDYGSMKLAIGEAPRRSIPNTFHQLMRWARQMNKEAPFLILILGLAGLAFGLRRDLRFYGLLLILFLLTGPLFFLLANLPFQAQSEGIMGRFFIIPVVLLIIAVAGLLEKMPRLFQVAVLGLPLIMWFRNYSEAFAHRHQFLVWDYGQAMLRSMPPGSILFLDGGDDAFYSLALLHIGLNRRLDLDLHDRGGLIYKNIYGSDFRTLPPDIKIQRRLEVEKQFLSKRPVFYSTMDRQVLPGVTFRQDGFLYEALGAINPYIRWNHLVIRSLYPLAVNDYRTRALGAFFPFMKGRDELAQKNILPGLRFYKRAAKMGADVDWLETNLEYEYSHLGYDRLLAGDYQHAEMIYRDWLEFQPMNFQAHSNLGVALEKQGRRQDAVGQYKKAARLFPDRADPVYNLAVFYWHEKNWGLAKDYLEEVLRRDPTHETARQYLSRLNAQLTNP